MNSKPKKSCIYIPRDKRPSNAEIDELLDELFGPKMRDSTKEEKREIVRHWLTMV